MLVTYAVNTRLKKVLSYNSSAWYFSVPLNQDTRKFLDQYSLPIKLEILHTHMWHCSYTDGQLL